MSSPFSSLAPSLLGVGEPTKFLDPTRLESQLIREPVRGGLGVGEKALTDFRMHPSGKSTSILLIIASAMIFVTFVAIYESVRSLISYAFLKQAWNSDLYKPETRDQLIATQRASLISTCIFALFCLGSTGLVLPLLLKYTMPASS